ncbi:Tricarboxylate transport protein TctB [Marinobacterium lacunae]|uniref:Tricarboxylate transport protein TctB n=1 Tax=Marinobacterium lacunae TaxID=1232683 RepID=A0A081FX92_9GAMM|nr:tripartite tricarboxylate transporter TctB family protein [Marinobacterium lacunae]KEA63147.1 Tricarboxylate transport protein TctB [Marinobacterium lacunae]MBR9884578.1 tripartite tricarboxylate transporter TctB family protein [Oceanospirillales bacterium]
MIGDRILGILMLLLAVAYGWEASQFPEPFGGSEAVGPETFPLLLAVIMGFASIYMIVKPDPDQEWPGTKTLFDLGFVLVLLLIFAALLAPLGFVISTTLMVSVLCWRMGAKPLPSGLTGLGSAVVIYLLFNFVLELHLPAGILKLT